MSLLGFQVRLLIRAALITGVAAVEFIGFWLVDTHGDWVPWAVGAVVWLTGVTVCAFWLYWESYPAMQRQLPVVIFMVATGVAIMAIAGVRLAGDRADWMVWMIVGAWLAGAAACIYESVLLTALPHLIVGRLIVISGMAWAGIRLVENRIDLLPWNISWPVWAVVGLASLGASGVIYWMFGYYYNFLTTLHELLLIMGLGAVAIAGFWLLNEHSDWLPWVAAGVWLVGVAGSSYRLYMDEYG